jgi:hypothetical protein
MLQHLRRVRNNLGRGHAPRNLHKHKPQEFGGRVRKKLNNRHKISRQLKRPILQGGTADSASGKVHDESGEAENESGKVHNESGEVDEDTLVRAMSRMGFAEKLGSDSNLTSDQGLLLCTKMEESPWGLTTTT